MTWYYAWIEKLKLVDWINGEYVAELPVMLEAQATSWLRELRHNPYWTVIYDSSRFVLARGHDGKYLYMVRKEA